uniref:Uncharacterized protein n=1 Tax=Pseudomonas aeruginosa TaxID=287 RepID=A0A2L1KDK8_PSEAI|nr:Hypothetical protein [Pseudomonas aeruginosa]
MSGTTLALPRTVAVERMDEGEEAACSARVRFSSSWGCRYLGSAADFIIGDLGGF